MEEEDVVVSMSLTASRNASGVTPDFVSNALGDVLHRFILVIECENRLYEGDSENSPPRFCVGSDRAIADPRSVAIHELVALGSANVAVPDGWEKAHEFLYVVLDSTDEHGWQYRSKWPENPLQPTDELWSSTIQRKTHVRWRLWMTTLVLREDFIVAKGKLSEMILANDRGMIMGSLLLRLEMDSDDVKEWVNRRCSLHDDRIEISDAKTGLLLTEIDLLKYEIKMLDGFAFSLRKIDGSSCVIFDADSKETRRRWLTSITYQMAVRGPLMDFAPFPYAPPVGDTTSRVILCGYLLKQQVKTFSWNYKFFKLTSSELQYFTNTKKKVLKLDGAIIASDESDSYKIIIKSASGVSITVKPDDLHHRDIWIAALKLQVKNLAKSIKKISWSLLAEERAMMISGTDDQIIIPSIAIKHRSWLTECEIQEKIAIRDAIRNTGIDIL